MSITKLINNIKYKYRCYKQRKKYGCDDNDIYSLDYSFYKWATPRIKLYKDQLFGLPGVFVFNVEQELLKSGKYKYDFRRHRFESKKIRDKVWQEAKKRWVSILDDILLGFEDALLQEHDFDSWIVKYNKQVEKANKELEKCKTKKQKLEVWMKYCPNYVKECNGPGLTFCADCFSFEIRQKSRELFAKYVPHMWL